MEIAGVKRGAKVLNNPEPPNWIYKLNNKLVAEFLRVAFDDEGNVSTRSISMNLAREITNEINPELKEMLLKMNLRERTTLLRRQPFSNTYIPKILLFNKRLLEKLSIKPNEPKLKTCYTDNKKVKLRVIWCITISSKENLQKFYDKIGFKLHYKMGKLKEYLENTKQIAEDGKSLENMLKAALFFEKEKGYFTCDELAKRLDYRIEWVRKVIKEGKEMNLIKMLGRTEDRKIIYSSNGTSRSSKVT